VSARGEMEDEMDGPDSQDPLRGSRASRRPPDVDWLMGRAEARSCCLWGASFTAVTGLLLVLGIQAFLAHPGEPEEAIASFWLVTAAAFGAGMGSGLTLAGLYWTSRLRTREVGPGRDG
jgi:hypothetical protein